MPGEGGIAHRCASDVPMEKDFIPRLKIASKRRKAVEECYRKRERELADHGDHKPKPRGPFQGFVRGGIQLQPVGPYGCAHVRFSLREKWNSIQGRNQIGSR